MIIEETKNQVEPKYTVENGYEHDAKVIYLCDGQVWCKHGGKSN